ncbi:MAG TPA: hypothetical protein VJA25_07965 [Dehalococcoidia bacterium]|nr:hypothetical protein [Dehalococcoidia bacterium]
MMSFLRLVLYLVLVLVLLYRATAVGQRSWLYSAQYLSLALFFGVAAGAIYLRFIGNIEFYLKTTEWLIIPAALFAIVNWVLLFRGIEKRENRHHGSSDSGQALSSQAEGGSEGDRVERPGAYGP